MRFPNIDEMIEKATSIVNGSSEKCIGYCDPAILTKDADISVIMPDVIGKMIRNDSTDSFSSTRSGGSNSSSNGGATSCSGDIGDSAVAPPTG